MSLRDYIKPFLTSHSPFHRKSHLACQQLYLVGTAKSAMTSCMSCWSMRPWGSATTQHSPGITHPWSQSTLSVSSRAVKKFLKAYWPCWFWNPCNAATMMTWWYYGDTFVRLGQRPEFFFGQRFFHFVVLFHVVIKNKTSLWNRRSFVHWETKCRVKNINTTQKYRQFYIRYHWNSVLECFGKKVLITLPFFRATLSNGRGRLRRVYNLRWQKNGEM